MNIFNELVDQNQMAAGLKEIMTHSTIIALSNSPAIYTELINKGYAYKWSNRWHVTPKGSDFISHQL
jgi:hypothetical protein